MSIISIIEVHTISAKELNVYLAEFIHCFQLKDRDDYEHSSGLTCLASSIERYLDIFFQLIVCCIISIEKGRLNGLNLS